MKIKITLLFVLLIVSSSFTYAQSKKDMEKDFAECTAVKDSIQKELSELNSVHDSINQVYLAYDSMYQVVKERVMKYEFDPENMSELIDSLRAESALGSTALHDSLSGLHRNPKTVVSFPKSGNQRSGCRKS